MSFSYFKNGIKNTIPTNELEVEQFLDIVKIEKPLIYEIRKLETKKERDKVKQKLAYATLNGVFSKRANDKLIQGSGFSNLDLDHIDNIEQMKIELSRNEYVNAIFISPSGDGLKVLIKIPVVDSDEEYKKYWYGIRENLKLPEGLPEIDEATKDVARACYMSYDPNPYYNPDSKIFTEKVEDISIYEKTKNKNFDPSVLEKKYVGDSNDLLEKIKAKVTMPKVLEHFGVDVYRNPTECPFHECSQACLSFNAEVAHCFDTDCGDDNSWNIFSFVKKMKKCDSSEAIKFLVELGGLEDEYEASRQEYLVQQNEPKGWAKRVSIVYLSNKYDFKNCHICDSIFVFNDKLGLFTCPQCKITRGLRNFAELIIKTGRLNNQRNLNPLISQFTDEEIKQAGYSREELEALE